MERKFIILSSILVTLALYLINQIVDPNYFVKSVIKIVLFLSIPYIHVKWIKKSTIREVYGIRFNGKRHFFYSVLTGMTSFATIVVAFFLLREELSLDSIGRQVAEGNVMTPATIIAVGLYIILFNSLLEEIFFRGFIFLNLYELKHKKMAYLYSSILFGIYHIGIFKTWFNEQIIALSLFGLIGIGLVFGRLNTHNHNILNSWIAHALADLAIMLIGLGMFWSIINA